MGNTSTRAVRARGHALLRAALAAATLACAGAPARAAPEEALQRRCWLEHTAERTVPDLREPTAVRFSNLNNAYTVRTPFWVEFGIRGMGVVPAGNPNDHAGHHHLLIDTPLPARHQDKIPFSDTHKHFGKGQTGTVLDLPVGPHTLRLLFADHDHRPYFVYSREITVIVAGPRSGPAPAIDPNRYAASCAAWYQDEVSTPRPAATAGTKEVYIKNLRDGEAVVSPFVLSLGVVGLGVAPASMNVKDSGHFVVTQSRPGAAPVRLVLADGRTETLLDLPRGDHTLEVSLEAANGAPLLKAAPVRVLVLRQH